MSGRVLLGLLAAALLALPVQAQHEHHAPAQPSETLTSQPPLPPALTPTRERGSQAENSDLPLHTLEDLEKRALEKNPALAQAEASLRAADARRPELQVAGARAARAEAALARARAERIPDLEIEAGVRQPRGGASNGSNEREGFADIGFRLPIFNRNQGGIAAAEADLTRERLEEQRVRLSLEARFAETFGRYRQAAQRAETYTGVLDRARLAYRQYLEQYQQMMAAYPQVLITERTLIQTEEGYVDSLAGAWDAAIALQTLLPAATAGPSFDTETGGASEARH